MKPVTTTALITSLICLVPIIFGLLYWDQLPEQLIIHWNSAGEPDGYVPKALGVFGLPLLMCFLNLFLHFGLHNDPKIANASKTLIFISRWLIPILTLILVPITLFTSMGVAIPVHLIVPILVGVVLIVVGNYLPKSKQNYTVGVRLPWTLRSGENWNRTHRLSGHLWICAGVLLILAAFLPPLWFLPVMITALILAVVGPFFYSYLLYRKGV